VEAGGGAALPGMILNTSKKTTYTDAATGQEHSVAAGRMECTMQVSCLPANCCRVWSVHLNVCDCGMTCKQNSNSLCTATCSSSPYPMQKVCVGWMNA